MKSLPVNSPAYRYIEQSFKEWLDVLGYAGQTVYSMPNYIRGLLHYIEQQGGTQLPDITKDHIKKYYYTQLRHRTNMRHQSGGLSDAHLNKHLQAIYKFAEYLRKSGRLMLPPLQIRWEERGREHPAVLTEAEIKQLYQACDQYPEHPQERKAAYVYPALALRDKAMLAVYYGCGLRRNEGQHIELSDIFWYKGILHVRKGKNYKERLVPISRSSLKHLENYLYDSRPLLLKRHQSESFFISERGKPMQGQMMLLRLNLLLSRTGNAELQNKEPGLHTLRHSIATHLLAKGMDIEQIKTFLGHSSLESTQIYTHLTEEENGNS